MTDERPAIARGALLGILTVVAERGVAFVVVLVLARLLSPEDFGRYGYLLAGMALVQVVADQGFEVAAVASMANAPERAGDVLRALLAWRLALWACVMLPVGAFVLPRLAASSDIGALRTAGIAVSLVALLGSSVSARSARRARGAMSAMARVALADAALGATAIIGAASLGGSLATIFVARAAASVLVTSGALAWEAGGIPKWHEVGGTMGSLAVAAGPLGLNALLIATQTRAGHLTTMALAGAQPVALLSAASRVTEVLGVVPEGALLALFPRMAAVPETSTSLAADAARRLAVIVLAPVCGLVVGAERIAAVLFGAAYVPAAPAIAILAWGALFSVTGGVVLHGIAALGRQRALVWANLVAAVAGVAMQVALIPTYGLRGAAVATVSAAACGQVVLALLPSTREIVVAVWRNVAAAVALALVVSTGVAALRPDLVGSAVAVLAFVLGAHGVGLIRRADWQALASAARRST